MKNLYPEPLIRSDYHPLSIFYRFQRRLRSIAEEIWSEYFLSKKMIKGVDSTVKISTIVNDRLNSFSLKVPFANFDVKDLLSNEEKKLILKHVKDVIDHKYNMLGSGLVYLGHPINWHLDYISGFEWNRSTLYFHIRKLTPEGSDIKRPWQLSRFHHIVLIALSWRIEERSKYIDEFISQILDWIINNPVGYGVNWVCPMEIAIRSVNWLTGYALLNIELKKNKYTEFRKKFTISLWSHARFIRTHLEWNGPKSVRRANHFLANITGLLTLGLFFSDTDFGKEWLTFSGKWIKNEIQHQVLNDGVHFECSTSYHRLCLEMFLWCFHLNTKGIVDYGSAYRKKLKKMRLFTNVYSRPDGLSPIFGDNDDGRLLNLGLLNINDHRYLWKNKLDGLSKVESTLIMGPNSSYFERRPSGLSTFKEAGYYVFYQHDLYLIIRAGPLAHIGDHAHCDQSSFELFLKRTPIFVDRGSYVYKSDVKKRNLYRSTQAHNVVSINGAEQNRAYNRFFGILDDTNAKVIDYNDRFLAIRMRGFKSLQKLQFLQDRIFILDKNDSRLTINDKFRGLAIGDSIKWNFHLSPGLRIDLNGNIATILKGNECICNMFFSKEIRTNIFSFLHSPSYGCLKDALTINFEARINNMLNEHNFSFIIRW